MLRADEDGLDLNRPAVAIPHADLSLRVRTEPGDALHVAVLGELRGEPVRKEDRQRHSLGRLVRGVSEHEPLIASPLRGAGRSLDGAPDLPRLQGDQLPDGHAVGVEGLARIRVPDAADHVSRDCRGIYRGRRGDLAGEDDVASLAENLAGDAGVPVTREMRVEDRVRDEVADLVRVALGNGLRCEDKLARRSGTNAHVPPSHWTTKRSDDNRTSVTSASARPNTINESAPGKAPPMHSLPTRR